MNPCNGQLEKSNVVSVQSNVPGTKLYANLAKTSLGVVSVLVDGFCFPFKTELQELA